MSKHEPDGRLDAAIDRTVRQMMAIDPPAGLRRRVLNRLDVPDAGAAWWPRLGFAAATLAALLLAVVYLPPADAPAPVPSAGQAAEAPARAAGQPEAMVAQDATPPAPASAPPAAPPRTRVEQLPEPPRMDTVFGAPDARVSATSVENAPPVTPAADDAGALPPLPPIDIPAISIAPIEIKPLTLTPLPVKK
jgi:hypothetical protein